VHEDSRGVTSAVGTVLLVAIVVLLGATVSVAVFTQVENVNEPPPNAVFTIDTCQSCPSIADPGDTTNFVNVTFETGSAIPAERLSIVIDGATVFDPTKTGGAAYNQPANFDGRGDNDLRWSSDTVTAGERVVLEDDADNEPAPENQFSPGSAVKVIWTAESGDNSVILAEQQIPE